MCLDKLEKEAAKQGISNLIADISSENYGSINFHKKHEFSVVGELNEIGRKLDRNFSIVLMQKKI